MMKLIRIGFGGLMIVLGVMMLVLVFRADTAGDRSQAMIGPLALMGAGALAISSARKPPKKW
ncbi:MAG: hypothetical protein NW206_13415 [Hyphomonadaceae bacterium]|nr:hypothetical protein [Hyphomonadaceae bacterium]